MALDKLVDSTQLDASLTYEAGKLRAKLGSSAQLDFDLANGKGFGDYIDAIPSGGGTLHSDLPSYVKAEAYDVAARVKAHLQNDSIVFLAGSDSHQSTTEHVADGNLHGGMSMLALAYLLPLDFVAYLGDYTAGSNTTTISEGLEHIAQINADIAEAFHGLPQFRTTGNHDPLGYSYAANGNQSLSLAQLYPLIGAYNDDGTTVMGSTTSGYCYRDFPTKKVRVICLNTAEADGNGNQPPQGSAEFMTTAQKCWLADTLISTPQDYGIILLAHHPLDWGKIIIQASHIVRAYAEELAPAQQNPINFGGVTYDFTGKRKAAWILDFHGHVHTFTVDDLHYVTNIVSSTTATAYGVKRVAVPNMCFVRNNEYGRNTGPEYYDIEFGTATTYNKTADSGQDTAWNVVVVNPSEEKVYAINYGAGIDREVYWGEISVPVTGVTLDKSSGTLYQGGSVTLVATVAPADASDKTVTWSSSNDTVATVNNGVVTAVALGTATITVATHDGGYTASYALTVQAVPRGNLMPSVGWFDDTRRKSDGTTAEDAGIVSTGFIDIHTDVSYPATVRIKGAEFRTATAWQANVIAFPSTQLNGTAESIVNGGSGPRPLNGSTMTVSSDGTEVVLTLPTKNNSYPYLVFNARGSGANLDLRINENFD